MKWTGTSTLMPLAFGEPQEIDMDRQVLDWIEL